MSQTAIRLGITGANAERGWAKDAHIAAIAALPRFQIAAVSSRLKDVAEAAGKAWGAKQVFTDSLALAKSPDIDAVVVTVRVPQHFDIVMTALAAGKHVFCEWPLGRTVAEAETMTAAATTAKSSVIIGTQGVGAPVVRRAAQIVQSGALGRVLSSHLISPSVGWGPVTIPAYAYLNDKENGATFSTIGVGHALAMVMRVLGRFVEVQARNTIQHPKIKVIGADEPIDRDCPDHMALIGLHESGCVTTMDASSSRPQDAKFHFTVTGTKGEMHITGTTPGGLQTTELKLEATVSFDPVAATIAGLKQPAANVAEMYAMFADKIDGKATDAPDFAEALDLHRLLAAIDRASESGQRQRL